MLSNDRGILFDITDSNSIMEALNTITTITEEKYLNMVKNAFDYTKMNNSYEGYYKKIIEIIEKNKI